MAWEKNDMQTQLGNVLAVLKPTMITALPSALSPGGGSRSPAESSQRPHPRRNHTALKSFRWDFPIPDSASVVWEDLLFTASLGRDGWPVLGSPKLIAMQGLFCNQEEAGHTDSGC